MLLHIMLSVCEGAVHKVIISDNNIRTLHNNIQILQSILMFKNASQLEMNRNFYEIRL